MNPILPDPDEVVEAIRKHCREQFPATIGNIPLQTMLDQLTRENAALKAELEKVKGQHRESLAVQHSLNDIVDSQAKSIAALEKDKDRLLRTDQPWDLRSVVSKLCEAVHILLHDHDYDGHGHELIRGAYVAAEEWTAAMQKEGESLTTNDLRIALLTKLGWTHFRAVNKDCDEWRNKDGRVIFGWQGPPLDHNLIAQARGLLVVHRKEQVAYLQHLHKLVGFSEYRNINATPDQHAEAILKALGGNV